MDQMSDKEEINSFAQLRELVLSINSVEDAQSKLIDIVALMSEINNQYIDISYQRYKLITDLQKTADEAKKLQIALEECLHNCQLLADSNLASIPAEVNMKNIPEVLQLLNEFLMANNYESEVKQQIPDEEHQLKYIIEKIPLIKEKHEEVSIRGYELKTQLNEVRKKYAPLLSKMKKMYDEIIGYLENVQ